MDTNKSYTELEVWKAARKLVKEIYTLTENYPEKEKFGLTSQIRRAAVSIVSNIAEGVGRNHTKDTIQFLFVARGSVYELEIQIMLSIDLGFLNDLKSEEILAEILVIKKLLNGFINYYQTKKEPSTVH